MSDSELLNSIIINPDVLVGKPVIRNTRLSVQFIMNLLAHGATVGDILSEYANLRAEDIQACLLYASKALDGSAVLSLDVAQSQMRFLVDECTGPAVARWLREEREHEVFSAFDESPGATDDALIAKAVAEDWILITNSPNAVLSW